MDWIGHVFEGLANKPFSADAFDVFLEALPILGIGMFGVFFFMFLFYLVIKLLCHIYKDEEIKE